MNAPSTTRADSLTAVRNAFKLGLSLIGTWTVALGIKLVLPRYLGPADFGVVNFAEAFAAAWFVITGFGIDTYVRKEIPVRAEHTQDFFGSVYLLRLAVSAVLIAVVSGVLLATGRDGVVLRTVIWFCIGQIFFTSNNTYAAILHATGHVNGLAIVNVVSKVVWGLGIVVGFYFGLRLESVGLSFAVAEGLKAGTLAYLARQRVALPLVWRPQQVRPVLVASVPFYLMALASTLRSNIDASLIEFLSNKHEVGWYGAASNVAGLALLLTPLIGWVLLPLTSRAAARSEDELFAVVRRSFELVMSLAVPIALLLSLGADVIVSLLFGAKFVPAASALSVRAACFVFTYAAMAATSTLIRLGRSWLVAKIAVAGLALQIALSFTLIPRLAARVGEGGAGLASAIAITVAEAAVACVLLLAVGRRTFDRRNLTRLSKAVVVALGVVLVDHALAAFGFGLVRVVADAVLYGCGVVLWKSIDPAELIAFVRQARRS